MKAGGEQCGRFHIDGKGADDSQVFLEFLVVLPNPSVGGVDGTCPVVEVAVSNYVRGGPLQHECRQGRHFRGKVGV